MKKKTIAVIAAFALLGFLGYRIYSNIEAGKTDKRPKGQGFERAVPVTFTEIGKETLSKKIELTAELEPLTRAEISSKVSGVIKNIGVQLGAFVKKDALIVQLDDDEYLESLKNAEISYNVAAASLDRQNIETSNLKLNYERAKELFANRLISQESLESTETKYKTALASLNYYRTQLQQTENQIEQAKVRLSYTRITAPFDGFIEKIQLEKGSLVSTGRTILTMVDISKIKTTINVPENLFNAIKPGLSAVIKVSSDSNDYSGLITNISPIIDIASKTGRVEITIPNTDNRLKPGMTANAVLTRNTYNDILTIPDGAIYKVNNNYGMFLIENSNTVKFLKIENIVSEHGKTGFKTDEPVTEKNKVVLLGGHLLKTGDKVIFGNNNKENK